MKKILIGVIAVIALCLSGCSDVGRYQMYKDGYFMIDTKTGDVYELYMVFDKETDVYHNYYKKMINETEANRIKFRNETH
jgi:hypothetical protein